MATESGRTTALATARLLPSPGHGPSRGRRVQLTESTTHQHHPTFRFGLAEWLGLAALAFGSLL